MLPAAEGFFPWERSKAMFLSPWFKKSLWPLFAALALAGLLCTGCDSPYGKVGGADETNTYTSPAEIARITGPMAGIWYSHAAGGGRLDGYRIGKWENFDALVGGKTALFPNLEKETYTAESGSAIPHADDYFVLYDDTAYGQEDDNSPPQESWGFSYCGIVRAVNIFSGDPEYGALIIEYLKGCAPQWDEDIKDGQRPFFGIYYRKLNNDSIQMTNAIDLAALAAGEKYYTETAALAEAIEKNNAENGNEFIDWGVVIPQDRER
jgi:hypothetical protein